MVESVQQRKVPDRSKEGGRRATDVADGIRGMAPPGTPVSDVCCLIIGFGYRLCRKEAFFRFCWSKRSYQTRLPTSWRSWQNLSGNCPQVTASRLFPKSQVTINTMTASEVEQASQIPGPTANATIEATPIRSKVVKNTHWVAAWKEDPSLSRAVQALEMPRSWAATNSHNAVEESIPFMGGRVLSVYSQDTPWWNSDK